MSEFWDSAEAAFDGLSEFDDGSSDKSRKPKNHPFFNLMLGLITLLAVIGLAILLPQIKNHDWEFDWIYLLSFLGILPGLGFIYVFHRKSLLVHMPIGLLVYIMVVWIALTFQLIGWIKL